MAKNNITDNQVFTGNIYIFHAFDVGDEIDLEAVKESQDIIQRPYTPPKYFKNYHIPLSIDLPHPHTTSKFESCKIHNFGAISLTYKIPFEDTLENIREQLLEVYEYYQEESVINVSSVYKKIKPYIIKPKFFHTRASYLVIQVNPQPDKIDAKTLKEKCGGLIASMVRFETETLSEYQKNEILEDAIGYFRGDMIVVDPESAFVYDEEYEEIIELFEFANLQELQLRYFDWVLDQQLNLTYEEKTKKLSWTAYLPFIRTPWKGPVADLQRLRVDISVITERLENSIKLTGEAYFSELYALLVAKLDLKGWQNSINRKLDILADIRSVFQHKIDAIREDLLSTLIIVLIFIELMVALLKNKG
ncbi:hypothetical protein ACFLYU_00695 [Candidatus Dependentiae bacterium]